TEIAPFGRFLASRRRSTRESSYSPHPQRCTIGRMSKLALCTIPWVLLSIACKPDDPGTAGDASGTGDSSGSTSDDQSTTSTGGVDETATETGTMAMDVPARGVRISLVEANSGVAVAVGRDGQWVDGSGRNAPIPRHRDTA